MLHSGFADAQVNVLAGFLWFQNGLQGFVGSCRFLNSFPFRKRRSLSVWIINEARCIWELSVFEFKPWFDAFQLVHEVSYIVHWNLFLLSIHLNIANYRLHSCSSLFVPESVRRSFAFTLSRWCRYILDQIVHPSTERRKAENSMFGPI